MPDAAELEGLPPEAAAGASPPVAEVGEHGMVEHCMVARGLGKQLPALAVVRARSAVLEASAAIRSAQAQWVGADSGELSAALTDLMVLAGLAQAAAVEVLFEAQGRGVVAESTATDVGAWARVACENAGLAVPAATAAGLRTVVERGQGVAQGDYRAAVTTGAVPFATAAALVKELDAISMSVPADWAAAARGVVIDYAADGASARQLAQVREAVIASYGDEGDFDRRAAAAFARREVSLGRKTADGMYAGSYLLDSDSYVVFSAAMGALSAPSPGEDGTPDERSAGQRRADALLELCSVVAGDPTWRVGNRPTSATRAQVVITMDYEHLKTRTGYGVDASGQPLSPEAVRRLACQGDILSAVLGGPSQPLDLGRLVRLATPGQVAALRVRDRGCTFPGCGRPASWCEAHHIVHWIDGGRTDLSNLALLCGRHHTIVHQHGYVGVVGPDGVTWTKPPDRSPARNAARPPLRRGSLAAPTSQRPPAPIIRMRT